MLLWMRVAFFVLTGYLSEAAQSSANPTPPAGYTEAQQAFEGIYTEQERVTLQIFLTSAGYWDAVPNEHFNKRLFNAIQRFQSDNGFAPNGILDGRALDRLTEIAVPMLKLWGFKKVYHPTRNQWIWIPLGLDLTASRTNMGLEYSDSRKRIFIYYLTAANADIASNFRGLLASLVQDGDTIHYKYLASTWYVISVSTPGGIDQYLRYHQDGGNVTGFSVSWNNANGDIGGDRIATLMSGSLWSATTGAPFIEPPSPDSLMANYHSPEAVGSPPSPAPTVSPGPTPPPAAKDDSKVTTGTGFFVSRNGDFVTNAHVIAGCARIWVKTADGTLFDAQMTAKDDTNDLALLRLPGPYPKFASFRIGLRLGEGIAAFGFPHVDELSSSGNFTLGNVTALTGLHDDSRFVQISAPVQAGNSGGPLLDQSGNLVGIVDAKWNALKVALRDGDLPQNVNFAINAAIISSFLGSNGLAPQMGTLSTKPLEPTDLADIAKSISGFVFCQ